MNTVCKEHEWVQGNYFAYCLKCGEPKQNLVIGVDNISETKAYLSSLNPHEFKPPIDFKIEDNLKVIESNVEDEFVKWLDEIIEFNAQWLLTDSDEDKQRKLLIQVKKKYLDIKKKNT